MRVYRYLKAKYGLQSLADRRLKISRLDELNDPFEFRSVDCSDRDFRRSIEAAIKETGAAGGVICFSSDGRSPVQWAHYANRHRGLCLGFDVPRNCLEKVEYVEDRVSHDGLLDEDSVFALLKTKHVHWEPEDEYRAFVSLEEEEDGLFFSPFSKNLELREVIVGANSSVTRKQIENRIGISSGEVKMFKVRASFRKFKMVKQKNRRFWS